MTSRQQQIDNAIVAEGDQFIERAMREPPMQIRLARDVAEYDDGEKFAALVIEALAFSTEAPACFTAEERLDALQHRLRRALRVGAQASVDEEALARRIDGENDEPDEIYTADSASRQRDCAAVGKGYE